MAIDDSVFQSNTANYLMLPIGMIDIALQNGFLYIADDDDRVYQIFKIAHSYINFQRYEDDDLFMQHAKDASDLGCTHIQSSDGRVYKIVEGGVINLTDQEMIDIDMKPPVKLTDADAEADLAGEPRPDNPSDEATEMQSKYTEPGDTDYCKSCDIVSKIDGIILARLNDDRVIDNESANVLAVLNQISISRSH